MKYITGLSLILAVFILLLNVATQEHNNEVNASSFLRIHIVANSNNVNDQLVKYSIKNEVVKALTPVLAECNTKKQAINKVTNNFSLIESVANNVLKKNALNYTSKVKLSSEYYPTRSYNNVVLESGEYDSLILQLGNAEGRNWWCVVYPPLCFVNDGVQGQVIYKSKLLEIIKNFFKT
jgi:stage II sporulation protein R